MGFLNDFGKKTTETTNKIARETKLKLKINDNKGKIEKIYEKIGQKIYEKHIREENIDIKNELKEECSQIDSLSREIEIARREILDLNKKKQCPKCFAEIEKEMAFCPECGTRQENVTTVQEEALQKLEQAEISNDNKKEAEIVKEELENKIENED